MMGPAAGFLLAILGCGEGDAQCSTVATAPVRYASQADCLASSDAFLARHSDADYPVVVAQCRPAAARIAVRADEVRRPEPRSATSAIRTASARR